MIKQELCDWEKWSSATQCTITIYQPSAAGLLLLRGLMSKMVRNVSSHVYAVLDINMPTYWWPDLATGRFTNNLHMGLKHKQQRIGRTCACGIHWVLRFDTYKGRRYTHWIPLEKRKKKQRSNLFAVFRLALLSLDGLTSRYLLSWVFQSLWEPENKKAGCKQTKLFLSLIFVQVNLEFSFFFYFIRQNSVNETTVQCCNSANIS